MDIFRDLQRWVPLSRTSITLIYFPIPHSTSSPSSSRSLHPLSGIYDTLNFPRSTLSHGPCLTTNRSTFTVVQHPHPTSKRFSPFLPSLSLTQYSNPDTSPSSCCFLANCLTSSARSFASMLASAREEKTASTMCSSGSPLSSCTKVSVTM